MPSRLTPECNIFAKWLVRAMGQAKLQSRQLAKQTEILEVRICDYRAGRQTPPANYRKRLAEVLEVPDEFLERLINVG